MINDDDEEDLSGSKVVRPFIDEVAPHAMSNDELASGENRTNAVFFLIDELIWDTIPFCFKTQQSAPKYDQHLNASETSIIGPLLKVSLIVNFSIQHSILGTRTHCPTSASKYYSTGCLQLSNFKREFTTFQSLLSMQLSPWVPDFREADVCCLCR